MIQKQCLKCNKNFSVFQYRKDSAKFCSKKCHIEFGFSIGTINKMSKARLGVVPWNKGLKGFGKGNKHAFKGIKRKKDAYHWEARNLLRHIKKCEICYKQKDSFQMVVHHKNENPKDNRIINLQKLCRTCHINHHRKKLQLNKQHE